MNAYMYIARFFLIVSLGVSMVVLCMQYKIDTLKVELANTKQKLDTAEFQFQQCAYLYKKGCD